MFRQYKPICVSALDLWALSNIVFATALILMMISLTARATTSPVTVGGPFALTAPDGTTVTDQTYRGKWLLVYFGYTFCPDTCPTTLIEIATALEKLGLDAAKLQPIFITVDPQRDTPEVMGKYTQSFDPRIVGLTGNSQQIAAVAQEYGAYYVPHKTGPGAEDYLMDHSSYLYVMDPRGKFVRAFDADAPGDQIADILRELMARPSERGGLGRLSPLSTRSTDAYYRTVMPSARVPDRGRLITSSMNRDICQGRWGRL
jgi:protein SCO1/2